LSFFAGSTYLLRRGSQLLLCWVLLISTAQNAAAKDVVHSGRQALKAAAVKEVAYSGRLTLKTAAESIYRAAPADSAQGDSLAVVAIPTDSTRSDSLAPGTALLRSALLPGWGQLSNRKPYKAAFFAATSAGLLVSVIAEQRALNTLQNPSEYEDRAARRNTRILFFALSITFAALDAYVDAQLANFGAELAAEIRPDGVLLKWTANLSP